jgi:hypothetical protein
MLVHQHLGHDLGARHALTLGHRGASFRQSTCGQPTSLGPRWLELRSGPYVGGYTTSSDVTPGPDAGEHRRPESRGSGPGPDGTPGRAGQLVPLPLGLRLPQHLLGLLPAAHRGRPDLPGTPPDAQRDRPHRLGDDRAGPLPSGDANGRDRLARRNRRQRQGFLTTASDRRRQQASTRHKDELADGYAEMRYAEFITVSDRSVDGLERSDGDVKHAGQLARLELQRMYGEQDRGLPTRCRSVAGCDENRRPYVDIRTTALHTGSRNYRHPVRAFLIHSSLASMKTRRREHAISATASPEAIRRNNSIMDGGPRR